MLTRFCRVEHLADVLMNTRFERIDVLGDFLSVLFCGNGSVFAQFGQALVDCSKHLVVHLGVCVVRLGVDAVLLQSLVDRLTYDDIRAATFTLPVPDNVEKLHTAGNVLGDLGSCVSHRQRRLHCVLVERPTTLRVLHTFNFAGTRDSLAGSLLRRPRVLEHLRSADDPAFSSLRLQSELRRDVHCSRVRVTQRLTPLHSLVQITDLIRSASLLGVIVKHLYNVFKESRLLDRVLQNLLVRFEVLCRKVALEPLARITHRIGNGAEFFFPTFRCGDVVFDLLWNRGVVRQQLPNARVAVNLRQRLPHDVDGFARTVLRLTKDALDLSDASAALPSFVEFLTQVLGVLNEVRFGDVRHVTRRFKLLGEVLVPVRTGVLVHLHHLVGGPLEEVLHLIRDDVDQVDSLLLPGLVQALRLGLGRLERFAWQRRTFVQAVGDRTVHTSNRQHAGDTACKSFAGLSGVVLVGRVVG